MGPVGRLRVYEDFDSAAAPLPPLRPPLDPAPVGRFDLSSMQVDPVDDPEAQPPRTPTHEGSDPMSKAEDDPRDDAALEDAVDEGDTAEDDNAASRVQRFLLDTADIVIVDDEENR
jgi:hypothetical protein